MAEGERAVLAEAMIAQALQSDKLQQAFLNRLSSVISTTPQQAEAMVGPAACRSILNLLQSVVDSPNALSIIPPGTTPAAPRTINYAGPSDATSMRDALMQRRANQKGG